MEFLEGNWKKATIKKKSCSLYSWEVTGGLWRNYFQWEASEGFLDVSSALEALE